MSKSLNETMYLEDSSEDWDYEYTFQVYEMHGDKYLSVRGRRNNRPSISVELSEDDVERLSEIFEEAKNAFQ